MKQIIERLKMSISNTGPENAWSGMKDMCHLAYKFICHPLTDGVQLQHPMKKFFFTVTASLIGNAAFCQMGPWTPIGSTGTVGGFKGWAAGASVTNGTARVICFADPDHACVVVVSGLGTNPGIEVFDKDGKSLGKLSYSEGRYRTEPGKQMEIELKDAVKF